MGEVVRMGVVGRRHRGEKAAAGAAAYTLMVAQLLLRGQGRVRAAPPSGRPEPAEGTPAAGFGEAGKRRGAGRVVVAAAAAAGATAQVDQPPGSGVGGPHHSAAASNLCGLCGICGACWMCGVVWGCVGYVVCVGCVG